MMEGRYVKAKVSRKLLSLPRFIEGRKEGQKEREGGAEGKGRTEGRTDKAGC